MKQEELDFIKDFLDSSRDVTPEFNEAVNKLLGEYALLKDTIKDCMHITVLRSILGHADDEDVSFEQLASEIMRRPRPWRDRERSR